MSALISRERIERTILVIRGHKVMMDADLAELYAVSAKVLNQTVRRNKARFPSDFMFQLTDHEVAALRSQIVTSKGRGGRQGVAMFSSMLRCQRAALRKEALTNVRNNANMAAE